jgi:WD40 repeat protein
MPSILRSRLLIALIIAGWLSSLALQARNFSDPSTSRHGDAASIYSPNLKYEKRQSGSISALVFSPDGSILASATSNNALSLVKVETGWEIRTLTRAVKDPFSHGSGIASLSFSTDGKVLASVGDTFDDLLTGAETRLWETESGRNVRTIIVYKVPWIHSLYARSSESGKAIMTTIAVLSQALWPASFGNSAIEGKWDSHLCRLLPGQW